MAGPLLGIIGKAIGAMVASQVGSGLGALAGEVLTASDIGLPLGARGQGRAGADQRHGVRRGSRRHRRRRAALPRPARGGPPAAVRARAVAARAPDRRGRATTPAASRSTPRASRPHRGADARARPEQPGVDAGAARGRPLRPASSPPPRQAALQRLEVTLALVEGWVDEVVGQATAERMPAAAKLQEAVRRRRAAGGPAEQTFASLVGPRAAAAPAARRLDAVGLAAHPPGRRGPRRRVDAPRPAAHRRRPRRPAGLPRGRRRARASSARRTSTPPCATCSTASSATRPDAAARRTSEPARRRARRAGGLDRARRGAGRAARPRTSPTCTRTPTACERACFPDHLTAGTLVLVRGRRPGAAEPAPQGPAVVRVRRPLRARRRHAGRAAACREAVEESGHRRPAARPGARSTSTSTRWLLRPARRACTTSTSGSSPVAPAGAAARGQRRVHSTCAGGRSTTCPTSRPEMHELIALARAGGQSTSTAPSVPSSPGGASSWAAADQPEQVALARARPAGSGPPTPRTARSWPASSRCASSWTST